MALALHSHHNAAAVTKPSWLRGLYQFIIDARQKQADARIAAHLRDLPDEVMRKAGIPDDAIEVLKAHDHTPYPPDASPPEQYCKDCANGWTSLPDREVRIGCSLTSHLRVYH